MVDWKVLLIFFLTATVPSGVEILKLLISTSNEKRKQFAELTYERKISAFQEFLYVAEDFRVQRDFSLVELRKRAINALLLSKPRTQKVVRELVLYLNQRLTYKQLGENDPKRLMDNYDKIEELITRVTDCFAEEAQKI